jgi:hypothetical protein
VTWTAAQYVARVIVEVAQGSGQTVRAVAGESFALTLWTWAELSQLKRERQVDRMGERTDLAGLVAVAFHQPADLQKAEYRYLSAAGTLSKMLDNTRDRMEQQREAVARALAAQHTNSTG